MNRLVVVVLVIVASLVSWSRAGEPEEKALKIADAVMKASGAGNWSKVNRVRFTFNSELHGELLVSAKHDWDVRAGCDTVSWKDKTVTVDISRPSTDEDSKAAHARWVNDSYWLLMPLKLKDPGLIVTYAGRQDGLEVLQLSFANVGLTPSDRYNIYIDPVTHLVRRWDYMPSPEKKISGTWDGYRMFGGLMISTDHTFGEKHIWISDIKVETE